MDAIKIWRFNDAPDNLKALSDNGGDEDWLALVPAYLVNDYIPWLEDGSVFGCCCVNEYLLPDGRVVRIGCHA